MSSKDPQRQQRKRNLFRLIDSFVPENIDMALQLIKTDQGLYQAAKQRYYPLMRLIDPKLGGGFRLLHAVAKEYFGHPNDEFTQPFIAHYAMLGEREIVAETLRRHPIAIDQVRNIALLNMLCTMDLPAHSTISYIDLPDDPTALHLTSVAQLLKHCRGLTCRNSAQYQAFQPYIPDAHKLRLLKLQGCAIESLPDEFAGLTQLLRCMLNQNRLQEMPFILRTYTSLMQLECKDNQFRELPTWLPELKRLRSLNVDGNAISQLPDFIFDLPELKYLSVEGNKLTQLPTPTAPTNLSLITLNLSRNPLAHFPSALYSLQALEHLSLNHCRLEAIPAGIADLHQLITLSLRNNPLTVLPAEIGSLTGLRTLDLRACPLRELPETLGNLSRLFILDLRGTLIFELPEFLQKLEELIYLRLSRSNAQQEASQTQQIKAWLPNCKVEFA